MFPLSSPSFLWFVGSLITCSYSAQQNWTLTLNGASDHCYDTSDNKQVLSYTELARKEKSL